MNNSILYWKWDETTLANDRYKDVVADIVARTQIKYVYISFHHIARRYTDLPLTDAIRYTCNYLNEHGKRFILDIDARNEYATFAEQGGTESARYLFRQCVLDEHGKGQFVVNKPLCGKVSRKNVYVKPSYVAGKWCFAEKDGIVDGSTVQSVTVQLVDDKTTTTYLVDGGAQNAGKTALVAAVYGSNLPDIFSDKFLSFYEQMISFYDGIALGGIANDEFGHDLQLEYDSPSGVFSVEAFPLSQFFLERFRNRYGYDLEQNLLYFAKFVDGQEHKSYRVINNYVELLRLYMKEINDWFYDAGKRHFGKDTFVGVHCTYWGDPYDFGVDIVHNGLDWWETKRDYSQTDEFCIFPIRLALMHKWGSPYWYNMFYSGNTQQIHTYYAETWNNLRFGGRTHYLGYECPNENGVFRFRPQGMLEHIDNMEQLVSRVDDVVCAQPKSSVLVLFGVESVSNWLLSYGEAKITRNKGAMNGVMMFANGLFAAYNCDLVPTSEVANGSVTFAGGKAFYGSEQFDAVVLVSPQGMQQVVAQQLHDYASNGGKLAIVGNCTRFADGALATEQFSALANKCGFATPCIDRHWQIVEQLKQWQVPTNRVPNGCVYRDGTVVLTADATLPTGNYFQSNFQLHGHTVQFCGYDYCVINFDKNVFECGSHSTLVVDGKRVK